MAPASIFFGLGIGLLVGMTGLGGASLMTPMLILVFGISPVTAIGTDIFHAAILLWAAGIAHWIGGNVDFVLAGNILIGSVPGVLLGGMLAVKTPQRFLRTALAVVLIASGTMLIVKEGSPDVVVPAIGVATLMVGVLFAAQAITTRGMRSRAGPQPDTG